MKKSFILHADSLSQIDLLSDEEAGVLLKAILRYVGEGVELQSDNRVLTMAFVMFKAQIDRDTNKYSGICEKRAAAAKKRWEEYKSMQMHTNEYKSMQMLQEYASIGDSDSDSDSDSDEVILLHSTTSINNKNKKESKKEKKDAADAATLLKKRRDVFWNLLDPYISKYGEGMMQDFFSYWTEPNKSKTKMRFELEKTWDTARRLNTWASRDNCFNTKRNGKDNIRDNPQSRASAAADIVTKLLAEDDARQ